MTGIALRNWSLQNTNVPNGVKLPNWTTPKEGLEVLEVQVFSVKKKSLFFNYKSKPILTSNL